MGDFLLNFNCRLDSLHPLGLLVDPQLLEEIHRDLPVKWAGNSLVLGNKKFNLAPCINTVQIDGPIPAPLFRRRLRQLEKYLNVFGRESEFFSADLQQMNQIFQKEPGAPPRFRGEAVNFLRHFGEGPGLTPAFDDFFAGVLLVDRLLGMDRFVTSNSFWEKLKEKTTLTSWWQLKFADEGRFSLRFEKFIADLMSGDLTASRSLRCLRFGHSSGTDICRGIYFYLSKIHL